MAMYIENNEIKYYLYFHVCEYVPVIFNLVHDLMRFFYMYLQILQ